MSFCVWLTSFSIVFLRFIASSIAQLIKNLDCNAGDLGSIPGLGRSPGGGNGNPLRYSCLENPVDRGAWQATVYGGARVRHDWAQRSWLSMCQNFFTFLWHRSVHSIVCVFVGVYIFCVGIYVYIYMLSIHLLNTCVFLPFVYYD